VSERVNFYSGKMNAAAPAFNCHTQRLSEKSLSSDKICRRCEIGRRSSKNFRLGWSIKVSS